MPSVLLVDDEVTILRYVRAAIRDIPDWSTEVVQDGSRAIDLIRLNPARFDVVLLDIFLPGLNGLEVYTQLRDLPQAPEVIAMSGSPQALRDMTEEGCQYVLLKPVDIHVVRDIIQKAVRLRAARPITPLVVPHPEQTFERRIVAGTDILDLDLAAVERHIREAQTRRGYDGPIDVTEFLLAHHGLVHDSSGILRPTYASILMFGVEPEQHVSGCGIDIGQFHSDTSEPSQSGFRHHIRGPLVNVIKQTRDTLWALTDHQAHLENHLERVEEHAYPARVLRELTVNALCHRDWSLVNASVQIKVTPTFIEWITPGGLPQGVDVHHLREARMPRNATLATFLYQAGYIEQFGLGMDMVYDQLEEGHFVAPFARNQGGWFNFRVYHHTIGRSVTTEDSTFLTARQRRIIDLLRKFRSLLSAEIVEQIGDARRSVQRDLSRLCELRLVKSAGTTRNRRYTLIDSTSSSSS